jgi:hypothetical protein
MRECQFEHLSKETHRLLIYLPLILVFNARRLIDVFLACALLPQQLCLCMWNQ